MGGLVATVTSLDVSIYIEPALISIEKWMSQIPFSYITNIQLYV